MIEKIKVGYAAVRDFLIYILTPIAFVAGYIYYLLQKEKALEDKIEFMTKDERQKQFELQVKEDEKEVQVTGDDYARLRDEYLRKSGQPVSADHSGSGRGDSEPGQTN